jgi:Spy/CpxP family protein refolding chaperone
MVLAALMVVLGSNLYGDDKTDPPVKGRLPTYWNKLGLTDEQKQKVFKVIADNHEKTAALEKQLKDLKDKEKTDLEAVLTDDQKKHLRELISSKAPSDTPKDAPKEKEKTEK